jgi:hypothetical protein
MPELNLVIASFALGNRKSFCPRPIVTKMNSNLRKVGWTAVCGTCPLIKEDISQALRAEFYVQSECVAVGSLYQFCKQCGVSGLDLGSVGEVVLHVMGAPIHCLANGPFHTL